MKEQLYQILNTVTLIAYHIPLAVVLYKKLWKDIPVLMFSCYWSLGGLINLLGSTSLIPGSALVLCKLIFNMIDVPFVLYIFYLNTGVASLRSLIKILIPVFILIEIMNGILFGFKTASFIYLIGAGVLLITAIVITVIIHYFGKVDHTPREKAKSFLFLAILFEYAVYVYIYIFKYILTAKQFDMDVIYYASTLIGIIIACFGFFSEALKKKTHQPRAPRQHEVLIKIID